MSMRSTSNNRPSVRRLVLSTASVAAALVAAGGPAIAATLRSTYSPTANNGGGATPNRADIITLNGASEAITGAYGLRGTSAHRFLFNTETLAVRNARGEVSAGYAAIDGKGTIAFSNTQRTQAVTYPDLIQGTRASALVFDNALLTEDPSTSAITTNYLDRNTPVYGDLRLADIAASTVTIATGDKTKSIYDRANFAILAADSGSTLYKVTANSVVTYDSRTATLDGADQDGLTQAATETYSVPLTTYTGVTFNGNDAVTDLASLKRYNSSLIDQLTAGAISPTEYDRLLKAAAPKSFASVTVVNREIPRYSAPPTTSERLFLSLDASTLATTVDSQIVGVAYADGGRDGFGTLIQATNGSTIVNNGQIVQGESAPGIRLSGAGTSLTNAATGVIGVGYETLDRSSGAPVPTGLNLAYAGQSRSINVAVLATDGAAVSNRGIVNVGNRDVPFNPLIGKSNAGIAAGSGATAANSGTILIGGGASVVANTRGEYGGAAGLVALEGGSATNAAAGTIRIGTSFAENAADLANIVDISSVNFASGMVSLAGGGTITNNGVIRIGSLAQNANGLLVGGDGSSAINNGAITVDRSAVTTPSARNAGISVRGSNVQGAVDAINAAGGVITIAGVNSVGLLVENTISGGSARGVNLGTIEIDGGLSVDRLRNYGIYVGNALSSARNDGNVILVGEGAIGVHARNAGTIDVGVTGTIDFRGANQIGYYALGNRSTINIGSTTVVDTAGSTGLRVEGGAVTRGGNLAFDVSGANAFGIVGSGASATTTVDASGAQINVSGQGATGVLIEGGATGAISGASNITLAGAGTIAAIVDGQGRNLDGTAKGVPIATTSLTSDANLTSSFDALTGYIARYSGQLINTGTIAFTGAGGTGILATTGARVTNSGAIAIGAGGTGIRLVSTGPSDVVTGVSTGSLTGNGGSAANPSRGLQADGAGARGTLSSASTITLNGDGAIGAEVINGGTVANSGTITLAGSDTVGIDISGAGSSATHDGGIALTGSGIGVRIASGGSFANAGAIGVASGTGILVDGVGSTLTGAGSSPVSAGDGIAALRVVNGGSVNSAASFTAGGTAHGVLVDTGAGAVTLGNGTIVTNGSGNGIENAAGSSQILLNGTTLTANGPGAAIRTGVSLAAGSTAILNAAGANSTGFAFTGAGGATIASDLSLGNGLAITASGAGATGVRLATTGNAVLAGQVSVANALGGAALVGGPAASITNSGNLVSASTAAPVVDLTGGTLAFINSGTITAASATATAIAGGANGQAVTLTGGAVTGAVTLGSGADTFLMTGGTLTGAFSAGGGNDSATFRGLTDTNLSGTTAIAGDGAVGGSDTLTFDTTTSTGTRRLTGWNAVNLVNGSALTSDGDLILAGGAVTIDPTSTLFAGNGVNGVVAAATGGTLTLTNAGTIDLTNGASGATDRLTVRGNYVGQNGTLKLQTVLATDGAPSDRLIIDGGTVSGTTAIQITNAGGLGARTTGAGIEVVSAINGGTTTARTTATGFTLAGEHVDAGAFEYRLYASDLTGASESWFLRTQAGSGQTETPTPSVPAEEPTPVTYRVEVPLLAALPVTLRNGDLAMLGTYHKRMGDEDGTIAAGFTTPGRLWGRLIAEDGKTRQRGDARPETDGHVYGVQVGLDLFRFGSDAGHHDIGVYFGHTDGKARVTGFASGVDNLAVGRLNPNTTYAAFYWTYLANSGLYVDTVIQHSWYGGHARASNANRIGIDGTGILASVETGYAIPLSAVWTLEPQVQVIAQGISIDDTAVPNAVVVQKSRGYVTGRLGARVRGRFETASGAVQPYLRANLWKGFASTDRTIFASAAASTTIRTRNSSLWGEGGAGLTWTVKPGVSVYGEADHRFSLDDGQGLKGHATSGSIGIKFSL